MSPLWTLVRRSIGWLTLLPARHPAWILVVTAALTVFLAAESLRVRFDSSTETIFHQDDPDLKVYDAFKDEFGEDEVICIGLAAPASEKDVFTKGVLEKIATFTSAIEALPDEYGVDRVVSLTNVYDTRALKDEDGFEVVRLVPRVIPADGSALAAIRAEAFRNPLYARNLVSLDGRAAAINVFLKNRPADRDLKKRLVERIREIARPAFPGEVHFAGIPVLTTYIGEYLRKDLAKFIPLTILLIGATLYYTFRSVIGVILPLVTVGLSCVFMLGLVGLLGRSISIVSSVVPSLVLACGSAEVIHVMGEWYQQDPKDPRRLEHLLHHIFAPIFVAGLTTVAGFGSMLVYDIPQIFEFGLYSAFGIFAEMLLALFFVPAALHYLRPAPTHVQAEEATGALRRFLLALAKFDMDRPILVIVLGVASLAIGVWGCFKIHVDTDYASYFKRGSPPVEALRFMRENLSGERPISIVLRRKDGGENAALEPEVLRAADALATRMKQHPLVSATISTVDYLKNLNRSIHGDRDEFRAIPESRALAASYLDLYGHPEEMRRLVNHDRTGLVVIGRSSIISSEEFLAFMDELRAFAAKSLPGNIEVTITGSMYLISKASIDVAIGQAASFGWADVLVFGMMFLLFRSAKIGFLSMIPNVLPIVWCYGIMGFVGVPLSTGTSVIAAMALGIVVDDTIHILSRYQHLRFAGKSPRESVNEVFIACGRPVIFTGVTNFMGFIILSLSSFAPLVSLGWLTAVTMITALSGDLVLQPALLVLFDKKGYRFAHRLTPDPDAPRETHS